MSTPELDKQYKRTALSGIFSQGYGVVPKLLVKAEDLSITTKMVLCYLLAYTGAGTECWPSHNEIIKHLKISKRTLARSINQAISAGYLSRTRRFSRGIGSRNTYHLLFMDDYRPAIKAPSKNKRVSPCQLEGSPERPPYNNKQKNNHSIGKMEKKSNYQDMERLQ